MKLSRLLALGFFTGFYMLGNLGGNYIGWETIFRWFDASNGAARVDPLWTHPLVLFALAILPSVGQWWREWFDVQGKWKWHIYVVMAADLAINTIGFYYLAMGSFPEPFVLPVFVFLAVLAYIPNVFCQSLATLNLKELLKEMAAKTAAKPAKDKPREFAKPQLPIANDIVPAQRRTNGSVPLQVEDAS